MKKLMSLLVVLGSLLVATANANVLYLNGEVSSNFDGCNAITISSGLKITNGYGPEMAIINSNCHEEAMIALRVRKDFSLQTRYPLFGTIQVGTESNITMEQFELVGKLGLGYVLNNQSTIGIDMYNSYISDGQDEIFYGVNFTRLF